MEVGFDRPKTKQCVLCLRFCWFCQRETNRGACEQKKRLVETKKKEMDKEKERGREMVGI